jgi:hypothetical protein
MAHELPVLVQGCLLLLLLRWIVDLSLQVGHSIGQVLEELSLSLEKLLHGQMHLWLLLCTAGTAGLPWTRHWGLINT